MSTQTVVPSAAAPLLPIAKAASPSSVCTIPVIGGPDALCDAQDFPFLSLFQWRVHGKGKTAYPTARLAGKAFTMHQLVLRQSLRKRINHRDSNAFNNCRSNLRFATNSELQAARPKLSSRVCSSIYKGVFWRKRTQRWYSTVGFQRVRKSLGWFDNEDAAARAYDKAAYEIYGEFAHLNFPRVVKEAIVPTVVPDTVSRLANTIGEQSIPLTNGSFAFCDPEDHTVLSYLTWRAERFGDREYAVARINGKEIFMHQLVLRVGKKLRVVHQDGNGLNNKRANLLFPYCSRICAGKSSRSAGSRFKGVWRYRVTEWSAYITVKGKCLSLGHFKNEEDAARAYDAAARAAFGPFAYQNFPAQPAC